MKIDKTLKNIIERRNAIIKKDLEREEKIKAIAAQYSLNSKKLQKIFSKEYFRTLSAIERTIFGDNIYYYIYSKEDKLLRIHHSWSSKTTKPIDSIEVLKKIIKKHLKAIKTKNLELTLLKYGLPDTPKDIETLVVFRTIKLSPTTQMSHINHIAYGSSFSLLQRSLKELKRNIDNAFQEAEREFIQKIRRS